MKRVSQVGPIPKKQVPQDVEVEGLRAGRMHENKSEDVETTGLSVRQRVRTGCQTCLTQETLSEILGFPAGPLYLERISFSSARNCERIEIGAESTSEISLVFQEDLL